MCWGNNAGDPAETKKKCEKFFREFREKIEKTGEPFAGKHKIISLKIPVNSFCYMLCRNSRNILWSSSCSITGKISERKGLTNPKPSQEEYLEELPNKPLKRKKFVGVF